MPSGNITYAGVKDALSNFIGSVQSQVNRSVVGLSILNVVDADNKSVTWDAKFGSNTGSIGPIADGATVSTFEYDDKVPASLDYVTYHAPFAIDGRAYASAMASGSPDTLSNLFKDALGDAAERMASKLGNDFYLGAGSGSNQLHGLLDATIPAIGGVGIYAGIDPATYTQWVGNVVNAGGAGLSSSLISALEVAVYNSAGNSVSAFICDAYQHDRLGMLLGNQRQYMIDALNIGGKTITLDGGFKVLTWNGIPVIRDRQCPAGTFIGLNTKGINFRQLPNGASDMNPGIGMVSVAGTPEERVGAPKLLTAKLVKFAMDGDRHKFSLYVYPQLQVKQRNAHGYITGLATS